MALLDAGIGEERATIARVIAYLVEVHRRGWYAEDGYSSLHDFCVRYLRLSEDSAYRRATAARLCSRFPIILEKLRTGAITLSGLCVVRPLFNATNVEDVLDAVAWKTKRHISNLVAQRMPRPPVESNIRPADTCEGVIPIEPLSANTFRVEFTADAELVAMIERAKELTSHSNPSGDLAVLFRMGLTLALEKLEYDRRGKTKRPKPAPERDAEPKVVTAATRREVFERDGDVCTYVSPDGTRCVSRAFIELDHVVPKAARGEDAPENLRVLCRRHNQLVAAQAFGAEYIERKIAERRNQQRDEHVTAHDAVMKEPADPGP